MFIVIIYVFIYLSPYLIFFVTLEMSFLSLLINLIHFSVHLLTFMFFYFYKIPQITVFKLFTNHTFLKKYFFTVKCCSGNLRQDGWWHTMLTSLPKEEEKNIFIFIDFIFATPFSTSNMSIFSTQRVLSKPY